MAKPQLGPIAGEHVQLRALQAADLPMTLAWRNQDAIRRWFFQSEVITPEQHIRWFEQYLPREDDFVFIIEELSAHGRPVGQVALYHVDLEAGRAEFGRLMIGVAEAVGKGLAFAATRLALQLAFKELRLHEVYLEVLADNDNAIRLYLRAGFTAIAADNKALHMSISRSAYLENTVQHP